MYKKLVLLSGIILIALSLLWIKSGRALDWAVSGHHLQVCRLLLALNTDQRLPSDHGSLPGGNFAIHAAVLNHDYAIIQLLLDHGADINATGFPGSTPLGIAVEEGDIKMINFLLSHKAYISGECYNGETPLHLAASGNYHNQVQRSHLVELLLFKGANPDIRDLDGMTPLHKAAQSGQLRSVEILLKHKAKINIRDNTGRTPLSFAETDDIFALRRSKKQIAQLLQSHGAHE